MNEGIAEYLEWRFQGQDDAPLPVQAKLRGMAKNGALPPLANLAKGMLLAQSDPGAMYAYSALAARLLFQEAGPAAYVQALRALGGGERVDEVFPVQFGHTLTEVEHNLLGELTSR
jgi:hypothetical protein